MTGKISDHCENLTSNLWFNSTLKFFTPWGKISRLLIFLIQYFSGNKNADLKKSLYLFYVLISLIFLENKKGWGKISRPVDT